MKMEGKEKEEFSRREGGLYTQESWGLTSPIVLEVNGMTNNMTPSIEIGTMHSPPSIEIGNNTLPHWPNTSRTFYFNGRFDSIGSCMRSVWLKALLLHGCLGE